ncbi:ATP synthase subunit I [Halothermothrix orenii]|uniref:ATP synthase I chain n=1 Tax=Halothermothrix orenii (strain H 168 / OCM 544 / DSM 9562) TaxID=373903 RepID=B8CZ18_HALOH|nr:ATP synthase subunit I [Halothermothrix orenii]ACL70537.1 hypothetical protein Hore_17880 [Halothermothrix orenii H 168]
MIPERVDNLERDLFKKVLIIATFPMVGLIIAGRWDGLLGLLVGIIISFLLFRLKIIHINRALDMDKGRAINYLRKRYFINYIIYFIALFQAYEKSRVYFIATAVGLLLLKYTILGTGIIEYASDWWHRKLEHLEEIDKRRNWDESRT